MCCRLALSVSSESAAPSHEQLAHGCKGAAVAVERGHRAAAQFCSSPVGVRESAEPLSCPSMSSQPCCIRPLGSCASDAAARCGRLPRGAQPAMIAALRIAGRAATPSPARTTICLCLRSRRHLSVVEGVKVDLTTTLLLERVATRSNRIDGRMFKCCGQVVSPTASTLLPVRHYSLPLKPHHSTWAQGP